MSTPSAKAESPTIRLATLALGGVALCCVAAMAGLSYDGRDVPDALASIGGGAVGALATLLTTFTPAPLPGGRRSGDPAVGDVQRTETHTTTTTGPPEL